MCRRRSVCRRFTIFCMLAGGGSTLARSRLWWSTICCFTSSLRCTSVALGWSVRHMVWVGVWLAYFSEHTNGMSAPGANVVALRAPKQKRQQAVLPKILYTKIAQSFWRPARFPLNGAGSAAHFSLQEYHMTTQCGQNEDASYQYVFTATCQIKYTCTWNEAWCWEHS